MDTSHSRTEGHMKWPSTDCLITATVKGHSKSPSVRSLVYLAFCRVDKAFRLVRRIASVSIPFVSCRRNLYNRKCDESLSLRPVWYQDFGWTKSSVSPLCTYIIDAGCSFFKMEWYIKKLCRIRINGRTRNFWVKNHWHTGAEYDMLSMLGWSTDRPKFCLLMAENDCLAKEEWAAAVGRRAPRRGAFLASPRGEAGKNLWFLTDEGDKCFTILLFQFD